MLDNNYKKEIVHYEQSPFYKYVFYYIKINKIEQQNVISMLENVTCMLC